MADKDLTDPGMGTKAAWGAAVGAVLGGLLGAVAGWLAGTGALTIPPGIGTIVGLDVFSTMITGLGVGAAIGAIAGAIVGLASPGAELEAEQPAEGLSESHLAVTAYPFEEQDRQTEELMRADGAYKARSIEPALPSAEEDSAASDTTRQAEEDVAMADEHVDEEQPQKAHDGYDPNSITGTRGAIDPKTGAYGTAGTPVTTGYGVSGSTVGVGSAEGEHRHEERGDFTGATPDTQAYETGGRDAVSRAATDANMNQEPTPHSVVGENAPPGPDEAMLPHPEGEDIYEKEQIEGKIHKT